MYTIIKTLVNNCKYQWIN